MIKRMALVRRARDIPAERFADRWRDEALRQLDGLPDEERPRRLAHCAVREGRTPVAHHGVSIAWFVDGDAMAGYERRATETRTGGRNSVVDGASTVSIRVEERTVAGADWLDEFWHKPEGTTALLLVGFIERAPHLSRAEFGDYWWGEHRPLANALVPDELAPIAYVHNYVASRETCRWDGIGEMYEASLDLARRRGAWFDSPEAAPLTADEERFLVRGTRQLLVTDVEVIVGD
jgi:hypothetical protein